MTNVHALIGPLHHLHQVMVRPGHVSKATHMDRCEDQGRLTSAMLT
jgi:hypothetical protein